MIHCCNYHVAFLKTILKLKKKTCNLLIGKLNQDNVLFHREEQIYLQSIDIRFCNSDWQ